MNRERSLLEREREFDGDEDDDDYYYDDYDGSTNGIFLIK